MRVCNLGLNVMALVGLSLAYPAIAHDAGDRQAKTAAQIFADARQVTTRAKNFRVIGSFESGFAMSVNLSVSPAGGGGTFELAGLTLNIIAFAAGTSYTKASEKAWQMLGASKATADLIANKWVKQSEPASSIGSFAAFTVPSLLVSTITSGMGGFTELSGTAAVGGQQALVLTDSEHDKIYIASVGTPYLLRVQGGGAGSSGSVSFSGFGHTSLPKVPARWINYPN